jgi:dihydrofolate reductase
MGRVTYQSILARLGRALPERTSIVVSSSTDQTVKEPAVVWASSVESAIEIARRVEARTAASEFFIIGGASVYRQALPYMDRVYLTRVHSSIEGDSCLPSGWLQDFCLSSQSDQLAEAEYFYSFLVYTRKVL